MFPFASIVAKSYNYYCSLGHMIVVVSEVTCFGFDSAMLHKSRDKSIESKALIEAVT